MHQSMQRSWVRSQHPSAQWNLRGGRWGNAEYSTVCKQQHSGAGEGRWSGGQRGRVQHGGRGRGGGGRIRGRQDGPRLWGLHRLRSATAQVLAARQLRFSLSLMLSLLVFSLEFWILLSPDQYPKYWPPWFLNICIRILTIFFILNIQRDFRRKKIQCCFFLPKKKRCCFPILKFKYASIQIWKNWQIILSPKTTKISR